MLSYYVIYYEKFKNVMQWNREGSSKMLIMFLQQEVVHEIQIKWIAYHK